MNTEPLSPERNTKKDASKGNEVSLDTPARIRGKTYIEGGVISIIARIAAEQVPGVHQIGESSLRSVFSRLGRHHGVEAETGLKEAGADLEIVVEFTYPIREVAKALRMKTAAEVSKMAGREVVEINVHVVDIKLPNQVATKKARVV